MNLEKVIDLEMEIWRKTYNVIELENGGCFFFEREYPEHPYWNLYYSKNISKDELEMVKAIADRLGVAPHYFASAKVAKEGEGTIISRDRYFYYHLDKKENSENNLRINEVLDLSKFSLVIGNAFGFDKRFENYFSNKLKRLSREVNSFHYCLENETGIVGTWSLFDTLDKGVQFLMNVSLRPDTHGQGLAHELVRAIKSTCRCTLVTHTSSKALMEKVFPLAGFEDLGEVLFYRM